MGLKSNHYTKHPDYQYFDQDNRPLRTKYSINDPDEFDHYDYMRDEVFPEMQKRGIEMSVINRLKKVDLSKESSAAVEKWSQDVKTKFHPKEPKNKTFFGQSDEKIVKGLGKKKATKRIAFFLNRGGKNIPEAECKRLERLKEKLENENS